MAFERQQPSVDLRAFLDPLKPGNYFDCGEARLYGIDEALEAEALRRGRAVGDDQFQLVATDGGLIFCRASIMFAIAARWRDLAIGRPQEGNRPGEAVLPISWPTHGDLQFTVSRRLGSNVFRRWLQLQAQATRRSQVEQDVRFERSRPSGPAPPNGLANGHVNGHHPDDAGGSEQVERNGSPVPAGMDLAEHADAIDLRHVETSVGDGTETGSGGEEPDYVPPTPSVDGLNDANPGGATLQLDDSDREAIRYATRQEQRRRRHKSNEAEVAAKTDSGPAAVVDPLATLDAAVVDEWVDDRVPGGSASSSAPVEGEEPTADPFGDHRSGIDRTERDQRVGGADGASPWSRRTGSNDGLAGGGVNGEAVRFEARPPEVAAAGDVNATQFMQRTADGTYIFPGRSSHGSDGSDRRPPNSDRNAADDEGGSRGGPLAVPVPEISGARLQTLESGESAVAPRLDIRSTLLAGRQDSEWVETLRERQVLILGVVTLLALVLIALIGYLSGDDGGGGETSAEIGDEATGLASEVDVIDGGSSETDAVVGVGAGSVGTDEAVGPLTTIDSIPAGAVARSTVPTLRVSSTSVQICHSNYGGCVPVAADVDCEGDGDGPAFQTGPVAVFGEDVYELDTDGDREACEPDQPRVGAADAGGDR